MWCALDEQRVDKAREAGWGMRGMDDVVSPSRPIKLRQTQKDN
jgi:hypothetical protein